MYFNIGMCNVTPSEAECSQKQLLLLQQCNFHCAEQENKITNATFCTEIKSDPKPQAVRPFCISDVVFEIYKFIQRCKPGNLITPSANGQHIEGHGSLILSQYIHLYFLNRRIEQSWLGDDTA